MDEIFKNILNQYILIVAVYSICGIFFVLFKWIFSCYQLRDKVDAGKILAKRKNDSIYTEDEWLLKERIKIVKLHFKDASFSNQHYPPIASDNKGLLMMWAFFWPINLIWTLFAAVVKEIFSFTCRKCADVLNAISASILPK